MATGYADRVGETKDQRDRVQALMDDDSFVAVPDVAAYTLLAENTGKVHFIPDLTADCTFSFPEKKAGLSYEFHYAGAAADAHDWVFDTGTNADYFAGGVVQHDPDDAGDDTEVYRSDGNSNSKFSVFTPDVGTWIRLVCDGTKWYVSGTVISATDIGAAFADQS